MSPALSRSPTFVERTLEELCEETFEVLSDPKAGFSESKSISLIRPAFILHRPGRTIKISSLSLTLHTELSFSLKFIRAHNAIMTSSEFLSALLQRLPFRDAQLIGVAAQGSARLRARKPSKLRRSTLLACLPFLTTVRIGAVLRKAISNRALDLREDGVGSTLRIFLGMVPRSPVVVQAYESCSGGESSAADGHCRHSAGRGAAHGSRYQRPTCAALYAPPLYCHVLN